MAVASSTAYARDLKGRHDTVLQVLERLLILQKNAIVACFSAKYRDLGVAGSAYPFNFAS